jgi:hypothetical protein
MEGGDMEANIAYYCLHKLHKWPHEYVELSRYERAVVIAAVQRKIKNDKKEAARARRKKG